MKKNVGILTFHNSNHNFGAVLQAYALYSLINKLGFKAHIINYHTQQLSSKEKIFSLKVKVLGFRFKVFRKKHIPNILPSTNSLKQLKKLNKRLDKFVVGSDQVWRYSTKHEHLKRYFFDFAEEEKTKISYAPSFGIKDWNGPEEFRKEIESLIQRFNYVSVREKSGLQLCKEKFNVDAVCVLDPTLLLEESDYLRLVNRKTKPAEDQNYIAYMLLDDTTEKKKYFINIAKDLGLNIKEIKGKRPRLFPNLVLYNSISNWLFYMKNAKFVVTDSFHCTIFSIIFRKEFICLVNKKRGVERLLSLLETCGLQNRLIYTIGDIDKSIFQKKTDYDPVFKNLQPEIEKSLSFLKNSLTNQ